MATAHRLFPALLLLVLLTMPLFAAAAVDVPKLVKENQDAVVLVTALDKQQKPMQLGSGFFVQPDGLVLTNYHVIDGASGLLVKLPNGAMFIVEKIVSADPKKDFALLQVPGRNLSVLMLGDSDRVQIGEDVIALGNPLGLESSVSTGIVSGVRRRPDRVLIQTTAPISHGSSGGPLLDSAGRVIGINTLTLTEGQNLNFAVAINHVKDALAAPDQEEHKLSEAEKSQLSYLRGVLADRKRDFAVAEQHYREAVRLNPRNFDAWMELGGVFYEVGQTDQELDTYKKAVSLRPLSAEAHYYLATAYEEKGQFDLALVEYRKAISLNPRYLDALFDLALIALIQGQRSESLAAYRQLQPLNAGMAKKLYRILELTNTKP